MRIQERYGKLGEEDDFDITFWQSQPPEVLFGAAFDLIKDYLLIKEGYAGVPRLQRTVESFKKYSVRYLVVGGYTEPRFTKDLDVFIAVDEGNPEAVYTALAEFGAPLSNLSPQDFGQEGYFYQMGSPPLRVDVLMSIPGVVFAEAWEDRETLMVAETEMHFISKRDLIRAKRAAGRPQDLLDLDNLERE